jgi:hypothetical protein
MDMLNANELLSTKFVRLLVLSLVAQEAREAHCGAKPRLACWTGAIRLPTPSRLGARTL